MGEQNDWLNQLTKENEDARGFYDELVSHDPVPELPLGSGGLRFPLVLGNEDSICLGYFFTG